MSQDSASERCEFSKAREQPLATDDESAAQSVEEDNSTVEQTQNDAPESAINQDLLLAEEETVASPANDDIKPVEEVREVKSANFDNALGEVVDKFFANVENEVAARSSAKKNKVRPNKENAPHSDENSKPQDALTPSPLKRRVHH